MYVFITLTSAGADSGPFNLYSNVDGFTSAFDINVDKATLVIGYSTIAPAGTTIVRIMSIGECTNYIDVVVSADTTTTTTTTTTAIPTTTTTTTAVAPIECYIYEYINTTESTTFSFGPYLLCPGPGVFDIEIAPGIEGVTFCIEQLSTEQVSAFNAMGLTLTGGPCPT